MEVRPQGAHGDEEVRRQEDDGECGEERHVARGVLHKRHDDADCGAAVGEDVHDGHRVQLHGEQLHGGAAELLGLGVHALVALGVGLVDFQRGEALQVLQKSAAQVGVGAPVLAHHAAGDLLNGDDGCGNERHAHEQSHGRRQAQRRQSAEQRDGGQKRVKQLRKILAEVAFQLLAALDADLHGFRRGNLFRVGRPHAHELVVDRAAHRLLRGACRRLTRALGGREARDAHDDGCGGHARQAHLALGFGGAVYQLSDKQPDGDHHGDVRQQRDPLPRHAGGDVFESLRHHGRQTFAEHGSPSPWRRHAWARQSVGRTRWPVMLGRGRAALGCEAVDAFVHRSMRGRRQVRETMRKSTVLKMTYLIRKAVSWGYRFARPVRFSS